MSSTVKLFSDTFKLLLALTSSVWALYLFLIIFTGKSEACVNSGIFTRLAWIVGIMSAPPLVYGLFRLLSWPGSGKSKYGWTSGLVIGGGVCIFVGVATFVAVAIAQYGCR